MSTQITPAQWSTVIDEADPPTFGEAVQVLEDDDVDGDAKQLVEKAIATGEIVEGDNYHLRLDGEEGDTNETPQPPEPGDIDTRGAGSSGGNPRRGAGEDPAPDSGRDGVDREAAVKALRDVLRFYNSHVDDEIADHTDEGEHPERPTTAREYFTDARGWASETVDDLLLGWAPADHVDDLVAWLHDRGHTREAILATGAVGESDHGGFYTTFAGRYVLPYYDAGGEPAYAIARATGGDGGGAEGYGGHPRDYQAGKYAKLRHTDDRVPFDEPIYGLDTLEDGAHVVVAEGIADAITARELGYAVLSPVARQFKEDHYDPLVDALEAHSVERVIVVGDADSIRNGDAEDHDPETVGDAVGGALSPVGAGLRGALNTADALDSRAEVDVRVTLPPAPADLENDLDEFVNGAWDGDLDALLRSAQPAVAFSEYDDVVDVAPAEEAETFDAEEYEPTATSADETTDEIRDIYHALDRLDAQRVAERTIVSEWLEERTDRRTFAPTWAPSGYDGTANFVDRDKWVDTGGRGGRGGPAAMAAIDAGLVRDTECPDAVRGETWWRAVEHLRGLGFDIPELAEGADSDDEEYGRDPREVEATVDPRRAWDAAGRVTPDEVDSDALEAAREDREAFACPECGEAVDVVRAVAIDEGLVETCDAPLDDAYPEAYGSAGTEYGAPLPEYYTTSDAIAEFDAVLDVIGEVSFFDLDTDAIASDITTTGNAVSGDAVRALNPAWRLSESAESVLVFDSGVVWDADTERVLDVLRFVALDSGLLTDATEPLEGEAFTEAYDRARTEYAAPLPRWEPAEDGDRAVTPQLPPSDELVDARDLDGVDPDALEDAREDVEGLIADATADDDTPTVVTALPALGKTTGTIKAARDRPLSYLAPRKELQQQALDKAERWGVDAEVLPVFAEATVVDEVLNAAVAHVREHGKDRLRERWSILAAATDAADEDDDSGEIFVEDNDEDDVDLDRGTCPTAEGAHTDAWALAVHVARRLGYTPQEIHTQARGLFGTELPCTDAHGEGDTDACEYGAAWDDIADPDDPADLLVGSYVHAHVDSVRTYFTRGDDDRVDHAPRAVVLDEFPGEAFVREFGEEALDHATWLARSLRENVADRRDMFDADLDDDTWVRAWLDGDGEEHDSVGGAVAALARSGELLDARTAAREIRAEYDDSDVLREMDLAEPLAAFANGEADPSDAYDRLSEAVDAIVPEHPAAPVARWVEDDVVVPLADATVPGAQHADDLDVAALPIAGDLRDLVERAVEAVEVEDEGARSVLDAATSALKGGADGCRRLAAWADDGYAHPDAHHILEAVATPTDADSDDPEARRIHTDAWAFDPDATDGTTVDVVDTDGGATTVLDRNDHGARLHTPPARTHAGGEEVPLVGLDATGRAELWRVALGEPVETADIHDTAAERARFLEDALNLRVLQAADRPRYYEGDPTTKDTDGDVALLEALDEEYAGIDAPRERDADPTNVGKPAAITTKGVREVLENDSRLDDVVAAWDNYGNHTGVNDLGEHRLAAVLGCQHYGDHAIERFAALAGEEVDVGRGGGRGVDLEYGSDVANAYLQHMTEDQTMQAILRFARGGSGATVVARTGALREDLPVVGDAQVVETWSDTATAIAKRYRRLGAEFTVADVADAVDVSERQVRRVLGELADAGYIRRVEAGDGVASVYEADSTPGAGEVDLPRRGGAVDATAGHTVSNEYYTWNVRVFGGESLSNPQKVTATTRPRGTPPAPNTAEGAGPPG